MARTKKKPPLPAEPPLFIYTTLSGTSIAAEEVERDGAEIFVRDPVYVNNTADGTGFDMQPVRFIAPGKLFRMYAYGLTGDAPMPGGMIPWFIKYQERRRQQAADQA